MSSTDESYSLNDLVDTYNIDNEYEQFKRREFLDKLGSYIDLSVSNVLELGAASGQMTDMLSKLAKHVTAVDGSSEFLKIAKQRVSSAENVIFVESYFESLAFDEKFDCLVMHHILEHVEQPVSLLKRLKDLLSDNGVFVISVPNAHALSRQLAVEMGLLDDVYHLTENDRNHGHYRVYDWKRLEKELVDSGFRIIGRHGLSFKLFADFQNIEMIKHNIIGEEQLRGLWKIADRYPETAGAIMIVADLG